MDYQITTSFKNLTYPLTCHYESRCAINSYGIIVSNLRVGKMEYRKLQTLTFYHPFKISL